MVWTLQRAALTTVHDSALAKGTIMQLLGSDWGILGFERESGTREGRRGEAKKTVLEGGVGDMSFHVFQNTQDTQQSFGDTN